MSGFVRETAHLRIAPGLTIVAAMTQGKTAPWPRLALAGLLLSVIWLCASWAVIARIVSEEEDRRFYAFHLRAATIALAAESVGRLNLPNGLQELARQPGIAWIAITNGAGEILRDSSPGIAGKRLYSSREMGRLAPGPEMQGRFLPDDENIYETWQIFRPGRLHPGHRHEPDSQIIFIALDAGDFHREIAAIWVRSWLGAGVLLGFLLVAGVALVLCRRYLFARRRLIDVEAVALQILDSYPWAILLLDKAGYALFANESANSLFGEKPRNIRSLDGPDWDALLAGSPGQMQEKEISLEIRPGLYEPASVTVSRLQGEPMPGSEYLVTIRELGETRRLKRKLDEAQRLAELGKIASGLAHEIRNPLSSICGYAEYLKGRMAADAVAMATAELLAGEAGRLNNVLGDLLQLAKKPGLQTENVELGKPLEHALAVALPDAKAGGVELEGRFGAVSSRIVCLDSGRIVQVILNLLLNAIQACQPGQKVVLAAALLPPGSREIPLALERGRACALITVSDTGEGMDAAVAAQIFTPYFTTRAQGAGLGLALSRQIIEAHGGLITVSSKPGRGSTFSIYLPQARV
ncbi:MAG: hypothetical protein HDQ91_00090 [Desulfovibrio sp.]|nr:hypothetical protein [Desulfovibrio sp.]